MKNEKNIPKNPNHINWNFKNFLQNSIRTKIGIGWRSTILRYLTSRDTAYKYSFWNTAHLLWIDFDETLPYERLDILLYCELYGINFEVVFIIPEVKEGMSWKTNKQTNTKKQKKTKKNVWDECGHGRTTYTCF